MTITNENTSIRKRGTQSDGRAFTLDQIQAVWDKASQSMTSHPLIHKICKTLIAGIKDGTYVLDDYGHMVCFEEYGKQTKHGWEIDHIHPVSKEASYSQTSSVNDLSNLRVLHWESNQRKADNDARIYELEYEHIILNKAG